MQTQIKPADKFGEWQRINFLADRYEPELRKAFAQSVRTMQKINTLQVRATLANLVNDTAASTATVYSLLYDPNARSFHTLVDNLVDAYVKMLDASNKEARGNVRVMIPRGTPLHEIRQRLEDSFGLDVRGAKSLEKYRQTLLASPKPHSKRDIEQSLRKARNDMLIQRTNAIARTESQRAINMAMETLWVENAIVTQVAKAVSYLPQEDPNVSTNVYIETGSGTKTMSRKEWVTRQDGRVCSYCDPISGVTARLGMPFDTDYGLLVSPPAHPNCRCFIILR